MTKEKIQKRLKAEDGSIIKIYESSSVDCEVHGIHTTWGALDPIQQLAIESGLDTMPEMPCILETRR